MFLIKRFQHRVNDEALLRIITKITDWNPWVITRKNKWGHINFDYKGTSTNCKMYSAFLSDYWPLLLSVEPRLSQFNPNLKKSWIVKMGPGGGIFPHIDYQRNSSTVIPLGDNKGNVGFHLHYSLPSFISFKYLGPTIIRTNITHSAYNTSNEDRYTLQFYNGE
jgi:hypothetical protein